MLKAEEPMALWPRCPATTKHNTIATFGDVGHFKNAAKPPRKLS